MGALVVVQARMASTRLPGKALADLHGQPVLARLLDRLGRLRRSDRLVLATTDGSDDDPLADLAGGRGLDVVRGARDDVLSRYLQALDRHPASLVVRVTGDNPLTDPETVDRLIDLATVDGCDYAFVARGPYGAGADVFRADRLRRVAAVTDDPRHREHINTFFFDRHLAFRIASLSLPRGLQRPDQRLTLDDATDLERLRALFAGLGDPVAADLAAVVAAYDALPDRLRPAFDLD